MEHHHLRKPLCVCTCYVSVTRLCSTQYEYISIITQSGHVLYKYVVSNKLFSYLRVYSTEASADGEGDEKRMTTKTTTAKSQINEIITIAIKCVYNIMLGVFASCSDRHGHNDVHRCRPPLPTASVRPALRKCMFACVRRGCVVWRGTQSCVLVCAFGSIWHGHNRQRCATACALRF